MKESSWEGVTIEILLDSTWNGWGFFTSKWFGLSALWSILSTRIPLLLSTIFASFSALIQEKERQREEETVSKKESEESWERVEESFRRAKLNDIRYYTRAWNVSNL